MIKKSYKFFIEFGIFTLLLISLIYFLVNSGYTDIEYLRIVIKSFGIFASVIFVLLFIILSLLGVSVTPLIILGGVLFSYTQGLFLTFISLFSASIIAFYIARFVSLHFIKKKHPHRNFKFKIIDKVIEKIGKTVESNCFKTVFFTKFFIANIIVSYALGTMAEKVNKTKFILATFSNNLLLCFLLIFLGTKFTENKVYLLYAVLGIGLYYITRYLLKKVHLHKNLTLTKVED